MGAIEPTDLLPADPQPRESATPKIFCPLETERAIEFQPHRTPGSVSLSLTAHWVLGHTPGAACIVAVKLLDLDPQGR